MENNVKLHDRIEAMLSCLNFGLYEKETAVRLGLLNAIAGENMFFLGEPGCAKSMVVRRIKDAFKADGEEGLRYFETLLSQHTTLEDVYGNISLKALNGELGKDGKERYTRLTEGMLPSAQMAFLDEIWKANPAILSSMLTILNEHKYHNGNEVMEVPLTCLFAASNELPAAGLGLEALFDRFVMRLAVAGISDEKNFFKMVQSSSKNDCGKVENPITKEELDKWREEIDKVSLSEEAKKVISAVRKELAVKNGEFDKDFEPGYFGPSSPGYIRIRQDCEPGEQYFVSDRRWKKIVHILCTSAYLNGRTEVDLMDCQLLEYCIWNTEAQREKASEIVKDCIRQNGLECESVVGDINSKINEFKKKVDGQWFKTVKEEPKEIIETVNGEECYKCMRDGTKEIWYVGVNERGYGSYHYVYNSKKERVTEGYLSKNGINITCRYDFTIQHTAGASRTVPCDYSKTLHKTYQDRFNKNHYTPIAEDIEYNIELLKEQKENDAASFKANLFANQEFYDVITSKINETIRQLEDAKVELQKQRNRYFDQELVLKLEVGDVILKNGLVLKLSEVKNRSKDFNAGAVAVVCLVKDGKNYAVGVVQDRKKWDDIRKIESDYVKDLPKEMSDGWQVPNKDLLKSVWVNRDVVNASLEALGEDFELLNEDEYWSSTKKDDNSAYFIKFDESGKQDDTTLSHEYAVCLIREWK